LTPSHNKPIVTSSRRVVIGADTHLDTIHLAAISDTGQLLGDAEFRTNPTGYWAGIAGPAVSARF
jgi:transposase